jgi:hypothetical protein
MKNERGLFKILHEVLDLGVVMESTEYKQARMRKN